MKNTVRPNTVSASSHGYQGWHQVNWKLAHETVKGIQIRIAKATREGNWRRVKALQRMLTRSFSAKALAVKRVTENQGKKTPGVDGGNLVHAQAKVVRDWVAESAGLQAHAASASLHPESKRRSKAARNSGDEG